MDEESRTEESRTDGSRVTVRFGLDGELGITSEGMWAHRTPSGTYLLQNIPFYAYGISYQDEVAVDRQRDGRFWARKIVAHSGDITLRAAAISADPLWAELYIRALSHDLQTLGVGHERAHSHHLLAITVSEIDDVHGLVGLLGRFHDSGRGLWEEAKLMPWWPYLPAGR